MKRSIEQFLVAVSLVSACHADVLVQQAGKTEGQVRSLSQESVILADNRVVPVTGLVSIAFSRGPVVAQGQSLVLTDGSALSGVLHDIGSTAVTFRSTSLGPVAFPLSRVAAVCFARNVPPDRIKSPSSAGKTLAALKTGESREGEIFGVSDTRVVIRTQRGLEQIAKTDLLYLGMGKASARSRIVLRNGDRLNGPVAWKGTQFAVIIGGVATRTLPIEALKEVYFQ